MHGIRFERTFAAAHRIWNDDSPCQRIHGHNYRVTVIVEPSPGGLTDQGFIVPWGQVKEIIDRFDHRLILDATDPIVPVLGEAGVEFVTVNAAPSTENLAALLVTLIGSECEHLAAVRVFLRETDSIEALAGWNAP